MKILGSLSLLLVVTVSYAAIEHDLQSLQQHLVVLEKSLLAEKPAKNVVEQALIDLGYGWEQFKEKEKDFNVLTEKFIEQVNQEEELKAKEELAVLVQVSNKMKALVLLLDQELIKIYNQLDSLDEKSAKEVTMVLRGYEHYIENFLKNMLNTAEKISSEFKFSFGGKKNNARVHFAQKIWRDGIGTAIANLRGKLLREIIEPLEKKFSHE